MAGNSLRASARLHENSRKKKKNKKQDIITYDMNGKTARKKLSVFQKTLYLFSALFLVLLSIIYIPPFFYRESNVSTYHKFASDETALKTYKQYLKDHPEEDFDGDGLTNAMEMDYGTNIWSEDSDNDGVSDYAEIFLSETSPVNASDTLIQNMKRKDSESGKKVNSAYKVDDILFWAKDYKSKAFGGVVKTLQGYRFWNYTGWIRFPKKVYAYSYQDGVHHMLDHRNEEDAWRIDSSDEIRLYEQPLTFVNCLQLPFVTYYLADSNFGNFLSALLPDQGSVVNCFKEAAIDVDPDISDDKTAELTRLEVDKEDSSRFSKNQNTLADLSNIYAKIDAGLCVPVAVNSDTVGEAFGTIYGYTKEGDLLVTDEDMKLFDKISIVETAMKIMDKTGKIGQRSWFSWDGCGFSSEKGDRICFPKIKQSEKSSDEEGSDKEETLETEIQDKPDQQLYQESDLFAAKDDFGF